MGRIDDRLEELDWSCPSRSRLPRESSSSSTLVHVASGNVGGTQAYISGHLPMDGAEVLMTGRVGGDLTLEQGQEAARLTTLSILASLKEALGDLDHVTQWVKALGLVQCAPGFDKPPR